MTTTTEPRSPAGAPAAPARAHPLRAAATDRRVWAAAAAVLVLAASFLAGRSVLDGSAVREQTSGADAALAPEGPAERAATGGLVAGDDVAAFGQTAPGPVPQVVRTASLDVRVGEGRFASAWSEASSIAGRHGGFVTNSSADTVGERLARGTLTVRVPADKMDAAVADFRKLGTLVRQSTNASDVSGELVDHEARLRSLRAQEAQLLELLGRAEGVSQVLEVRTRLDQVRTEIEQTQARRDHLQSQVDLSTITASIFEPSAETGPTPDGPLARALSRAVDAFLSVIAGAIVVAGALLPFALLAAAAWAVVRVVRARTPSPTETGDAAGG